MPCPPLPASSAYDISMVSSMGATLMPCWARTLRSYLMFCPILRTEGSSSSGFSSASASAIGTCTIPSCEPKSKLSELARWLSGT